MELVNGGINLNGYFLSDGDLMKLFKSSIAYTKISSCRIVPDLTMVQGIVKSEVFIGSNNKTEKMMQY